jgi:hypothetical protein
MREQVGTVFEEEIERRTGVSDDNIDGAGSIFLPYIIAEEDRLALAWEPIGFQVFGIILEGSGRGRFDGGSKRAFEVDIGGVGPVIPVQYQQMLGASGLLSPAIGGP